MLWWVIYEYHIETVRGMGLGEKRGLTSQGLNW